jgi:erythromycin esterase-like protein
MIEADVEVLPRLIAEAAEPLPDIEDRTFGEFFGRFADARVVLLGEASHGTSEFYRARAAISRHLIERHGFTIVAVEGDWPDAASLDRYVRHRPPREGEFRAFERFPTWMWRNREVDDFIRWLRRRNGGASMGRWPASTASTFTICRRRCGRSSTSSKRRIPGSPGSPAAATAASTRGRRIPPPTAGIR